MIMRTGKLLQMIKRGKERTYDNDREDRKGLMEMIKRSGKG
jgi:hypothetical protein